MNTSLKPSQIITMASGAIMLIFSFFAWYKYAGDSKSAWSSGLFPLATFVPIFGLLAAAVMAATVFGNVKLPEPILGFDWRQIHFLLAFTALVIAIGYLLLDAQGIDKGIGFWFNLLGAIGLMVGAVMALRESGAGTSPSRGGSNSPF